MMNYREIGMQSRVSGRERGKCSTRLFVLATFDLYESREPKFIVCGAAELVQNLHSDRGQHFCIRQGRFGLRFKHWLVALFAVSEG